MNPQEPAQTPDTNSSSSQPTPAVPATWPGAFGAYKHSRNAVKFNLSTVLLLVLLTIVVTAFDVTIDNSFFSILANIVSLLISLALIVAYISGVRRQKVDMGTSLSQTLPLLLKGIVLNVMVVLSVILGLLLLIVPGLILIARLSLANYFLVDKKLGIMEAYKASWEATKGYAMKVWGIIGVTILMALLIITIIGIPFAIYLLIMYSAAFAILYEYINRNKPAVATSAT